MEQFDVIIVGGGPAGLSAALILARCRRKVLLCDAGQPRNIRSRHMHGYLTRDGIAPQEFLNLGREELSRYECTTLLPVEVKTAARLERGFRISLQDGQSFTGRKMLLATGIVDELPKLAGLHELYGKSVFHCPYCDAWEVRDKALAVYGHEQRGYRSALMLRNWSRDITLFTDGVASFKIQERDKLAANGILVEAEKVTGLAGQDGQLRAVVLVSGREVPREYLFFNMPSCQRSSLAVQLGCRFNSKGGILAGKYEATDVPGLYAAGNILLDVQLVVVAAAEGAKAAFGINAALQKESLA